MQTPELPTRNVFGISFCADTRKAVLDKVRSLAEQNHASAIILANAHVVVEAHHNQNLKHAINRAALVVSDGVPVTWVLRYKGLAQVQPYAGMDLMGDVLRVEAGKRHFFLGSTTQILDRIQAKFKGNTVGVYSPPFSDRAFSDEELRRQLELVSTARPDFIWVGLGAPKQEYYVTQMSARAGRGVWLAVGAAFDFYAGAKPRAPRILQKMGLEWSFRMLSEPRRLARRYATTNPIFVKLALSELFSPEQTKKSAAHAGSDCR